MAKSDARGRFEIKNLPIGEHTFRVWHERAGYVRNQKFGALKTDSKGRLTIRIQPGRNDIKDVSIPIMALTKP